MFPNLLNARDLGRYVTQDGRQLNPRAFVRSDLLDRLTEEGFQALLDYGIRTVIDLRWSDELERSPNPLAQDGNPIDYFHHSLLGESYPDWDKRESALQNAHWYQSILDLSQSEIAQILRVMANTNNGGVLFHCKMGKDRTGIISMLLLALAGAPQQTIIDDYALTAVMLEEEHKRYLSQFNDPEERKVIADDQLCLPEYAQYVLDHLTVKYGGINRYLTMIGLSSTEIALLHKRLIG